jgi:hypothetical protein
MSEQILNVVVMYISFKLFLKIGKILEIVAEMSPRLIGKKLCVE